MILLIALCVFFGAVQAEIIKDPSLCSRTKCTVPDTRKFKYEQGVSYRYAYSVDVSTNLGTHPRNESTLRLDAVVSVRFDSPCEGSLKFHNASISHEPERYNPQFPDRAGAEFKLNLERFVLRFAFDDGRIREVCPDRGEAIWSLNLKRGVLSMLQNTMLRFDVDRRVDELDVNGICETDYRLREAKRTSLIIKKTKNLSGCAYGSKHLSIVRSTAYRSSRSSSRPSRHPLLESRSECEITIDHNVYEKVVCEDVHRLQPLSSGETGARTESRAVLRLIEEAKDGYLDEYEESNEERSREDRKEDDYGRGFERIGKTNLLYDYAKTPKTMHGELRTSRDLLKTMCRQTSNPDELQQRFSETFTLFVHSSRLLDYPSLSQLFARANGICKTGKKHIIDALPFMGSNAAINLMKDLIGKMHIDRSKIDNWITTFAFIPRPNRETIEILAPLLQFQSQIPDAQFVLSYSALIHSYCTGNEARCADVEEVTRFLSHLEEKIETGCAPRSHDLSTTKETLEALKALGNTGLETESLLNRLKECVDDVGGFLPMEVRVAAIDAHRRLPSCERTRDRFFLDYYRNYTLDTEIRIASYLQVMRCPDYNVIKTIKHTLQLEEVNQVGTFVWSHLTNLYNSASPTRIEIQSLLTDRDLGSKFNSDVRKYSRNYDGSFFSEEYNFGANYQGNLIFSPKSYVPRSATFNVTLDLFGESVNAFEITTRLEGLEYYAEKFFGPDGPYSNEKVTNHFRNFLRSFRAAPEEDEDYWKRVKRLPNVIDNDFRHPRIAVGYKVFGNELKYTMFNGEKEIGKALANLNPWEKLKEIASGKEIRYENTVMFLDSTYVVPLTSGLPVRLDFAGSAAWNFKMSGLLDAERISSGEVELAGNIVPSASVDVVGSMTVDAFYKTAGVKLRTNLYSAGAVHVRLNVKGRHLIRLSLGLPNKKMEVFSVGTDVLLTRGNGAELEEKPLGVLIAGQSDENSRRAMVPRGTVISNTSCTWTALDRLVGLKLCVDYQLSNVTKNPSSPYFVLCGPTLFKVSLIKADPTAKSYLLEYKWDKTEEQSTFRLAFDTPGSQVNRELSASVSFYAKTHNVTVLLRSAGNSVVAEGTYRSSENETVIDVSFDVNGTKHLDASVGYTTKKFNHGYTFSPNMHLIVNNERVAALSGNVRNARKNNVSQCDIDLTFRTKKVWSKLVGYIVRRNVSIAGDFQLDYQLQKMPKKETLHLEVSLSNRSSKTLTHKAADLKLRSTAYPQLNTVIIAWYQQALGHLELHAEVNSSPHLRDDRHKLTAQLVVSYSKMYFQNQGTKVSALFAVTKPIQNLDIKVGINHYAVGAETRTGLLIGYAPEKEISLTVNTIMPRGLMFSMEGHANLTIPNFDSMLLDARITERSRREYELDFAGTWFSGHNVTARGTYSDRSVATVVSHSLKLILKSPSFASDVLVNCKVYRNYSDVRISLYVEQVDRDKYAFVLNHTVFSPTSVTTYVEGRYKNSVYSVTTNIDSEREVRVEMHLDQWRDVHLTLTGINEESKKGFGAEVKWDANRDPALKVAIFFLLDKAVVPYLSETRPSERNLSAVVTFTYPGRLVTGSCLLAVRGKNNYMMDLTIGWSPEKVIKMSMDANYDLEPWMKTMKFESQLLTPFENWKRTALNAKYLQDENKMTLSSSAHWKDSQHVMAEFEGTAKKYDGISEWKANCGLTSTVHAISWTTVNVTHKILDSKVADTRLSVKYNPDKSIEAWSIWQLDKVSDEVFNLTGNLHLESPLTSYKKSDMRCQLQILPNWKFLGAANLDLDKRKYTANLIGDLRRIKESMVEFNVSTPLEKYAFVKGRFGLSESNRHVVAEIVTPSGPLGFEAICQFFTSEYDFNVKLLLATPLDVLQKALLVAKLNKREADFRIAYNNMMAGFQGVWHYRNITDFHYRYLLFTPIRNLEESGVTAKLVLVNSEDGNLDVDTDFSVRLGDAKIGIRAKGGPKAAPVRIPIKAQIDVSKDAKSKKESGSGEEEEYTDDAEEEEQDTFYWRGEFEVCPAIFEPITGELDIDNEGPTYKILSTLEFFKGKVILDDTFWIEDVFHLKNDLNLVTPFQFAHEITSLSVFLVDLENSNYVWQMDVNVRRNSTWSETGLAINYTYGEGESDDSKTHTLKLNAKTPLEFLKFVNTRSVLDIDENLYRSTVVVRMEDTSIDLFGSLETDEGFVDAIVVAEFDTPMLKLPKSKLTGKKDFTEREKVIKLSAEIAEPISKSVSLQSAWEIEENRVKVSTVLNTWLEAMKNLEADFSYSNSIANNDTATVSLNVKHLQDQEYKFTGNYSDGALDCEVYTPLSDEPHFQFHGDVEKMNDTLYNVHGELLNLATSKVHKVSTVIVTRDDGLHTVDVTMRPETSGSERDAIFLRYKKEKYGLHLEAEGRLLNGTVDANFVNSLNWDVRARADIANKSGGTDRYQASTFANVQVNGNASLYAHAETPLRGFRNATLNANALTSNNSGDVRVGSRLNEDTHYAALRWKLVYMVDMFVKLAAGYQMEGYDTKDVDAEIFFASPGRSLKNVNAGFGVDVDREKWKFATNLTVGFRNHENADVVVAVRLPPPDNDDHRFLLSYHANGGIKDASYVVGYNALRAKTNYASDGSLRMVTRNIDGHVRVAWGTLPSQSIKNLLNVTFDNKEIELKYSLYTAKFLQEQTLVFLFAYNGTNDDERRSISADLFYPASSQVGTAKISYESLANVNGTLDAVLPFANVSRLGCQFVVFTTIQRNKRYAKFSWPRNTAILDSDYVYRSEKLDSNLEGVLRLEVPLNTRHVGHLTYGYKKRPQVTTGYSELTYNGGKILHARYNSKSESRAGFEKDRIEISVENFYKPIGVLYINQYEYSAGNEGTNYPTVEFKHVNLYRLDNKTAFNVAGESRIRTTLTGQNIHLKAMHSNGTLQIKTDYEILPGEFDQTTWLSLADDAWLSYRVNVLNKTTESMDNQFLILAIAYPRRNFTLDGSYKITGDRLSSEAKLEWDRETDRPKTVGATFDWSNVSSPDAMSRQRAVLGLRHPTFPKDVTVEGQMLKRDYRDLLNVALVVDYSLDPEKRFDLSALLRDESDLPVSRKYVYKIAGRHPSTKLRLDVGGFVRKHENVLLETSNNGSYARTFSPEERGKLDVRLDLESREVLFHRAYQQAVKYLRVKYWPSGGRYVVNGSIVNTPDLNATGALFLDPREKLTWMSINYTPDAVESLRMYGSIPDARNAVFDVWRTYDQDFTVSDVSFYLKLNHSRLVTSTLRWRPELRSDVINFLKRTALDAYEGLNNDADYWKQYIKSETVSVISGVWDDAQEDLGGFLDDWNDLKELEADFEDLKIYLNDSYNANDFYVKDLVTFGMYMIDELSLRSHIQSLPNILNEIWEIMGESGEAIRNSLLWIIDAIKNACNKVSEIVGAILRGDSIAQVAHIIEQLIEKYDMFVKDLHVSFIKYIENLWNKISLSISQQWNRFLLMVEPLFIRFVHHLETAAWKASKEVVDFLYDRRNDIIASPYFDRFANFSQDIDKFYRDVKANDIVTNVQKYSGLVIRFLEERYFTFVPFGKELKDVIDEIATELKELQKLPSIRYATEKTQQLYERVRYVLEYLEVRAKIESIVRLIHSKLVDISQTALQAESRYREAKTKFVFDPNQGILCLEQKLPMSWHAFNQTPEFHEIPEFRAIADTRAYFVASNVTFWNLYYRYKPYTEPLNWLPPFKAQAMIVGAQRYASFDGRHLDFVGPCTYLLARDFVRDTFALLVKYDLRSSPITHRIVVLVGDNAIELDIFNDSVKLVQRGSTDAANNLRLPVELENGTTYVYQEENVVTVEREHDQFRLECNLKFDLCTLELSGWYYGKTAGILGTMSNERTDDTTASDGSVSRNVASFARSWSIDADERCSGASDLALVADQEDPLISEFCSQLFVNRSSEFASCFAVIEPNDYAEVCLRSGEKSRACTVAISYMQACMFHDTYLRIPDMCTSCTITDGSQIPEGQFKKLEGETVPKSADVVFLVEGKECNRDVKANRSMDQLLAQLNKELKDQGLDGNRWSLVVFGANGVFERPRSIVLDGQIFAKNVARFIDYFDHVPVGNGSEDIFEAIGFASRLVFRAGVSKTFILMPCSHCEPENQTLDYSVLHQVLLEHDITLHILMDGEFEFEKERLNKIFYGLDATRTYTKKDARALSGDVDLRRQVKLSKDILGYCTPLSLETNGTIFSSNKLRFDKLASIKKFASVFSKRVALTAQPSPCQHCECTADNNGVTRMECMPCVYPTPVTVDYDTFNLNDSLSALQPLNIDYGQIDIGDD